MEEKTLKDYCKEAKKRLKNGFWQNYQKGLNDTLNKAKEEGVSESVVKEYYIGAISENIKNTDDDEFYMKVKNILDSEGEVSDALGRLTDFSVYNSLSYEDKQRYTLSLSERYLKAVEKYNREKCIIKA